MQAADRDTLNRFGFEEPNLNRALHLAEESEHWAAVLEIANGLARYYYARGRRADWTALRSQILDHFGRETPSVLDYPNRVDLWTFLLTDEANDALDRSDFHAAEAIYRSVLGCLQSNADPERSQVTADIHCQLGKTASLTGRFDEAEPLLLDSYPIIAADRGATNRRTLEAIERIVDLYDSWGNGEAAAKWRAKLTEQVTNRFQERGSE